MQALAEEQDCFHYDELSDEAKENARNWYRGEDSGLDYDWWDSVYEDAKEIGKLIGIDIREIYFSGFWNQGDGACFVGDYEFKPCFMEAVKEHAPNDDRLHNVCQDLLNAQAKNLFCMRAYGTQPTGNYYHENSVNFEVECDDEGFAFTNKLHDDELIDALRAFMKWIYRRLEAEYEYLTSDEEIAEILRANEYEFTEDGEQY